MFTEPITMERLMTKPGLFESIRLRQIDDDELEYQRRLIAEEKATTRGGPHKIRIEPTWPMVADPVTPEKPFPALRFDQPKPQSGWYVHCDCGRVLGTYPLDFNTTSLTCRSYR